MPTPKHIANGNVTAPTLTTPCSLQALRLWLENIDVLSPATEVAAQVTTTSSTLTVA